jgi:hypothetical protein
MKIRTSEIDRGFKISIEDISFLGNCDDETFIKKDSSKTIYDINNGRIKEIKKF